MKTAFLMALGALAFSAAPVSAKPIKLEFSGSVIGLTDGLGLFSGVSVGQAAKLTYFFDDAIFTGHILDATYDYGGIDLPYRSVFLNSATGAGAIKGTVTLGSVTQNLSGSAVPGNPIANQGTTAFELEKIAYGDAWGFGSVDLRSRSVSVIGFEDHNDFYDLEVSGGSFITAPDGITNMDLTAPLLVDGGVGFQYSKTIGTGEDYATSYGSISFGTLTISEVAAAPEPATWAMMIIGFGAAGAMFRRIRRESLKSVST